MNVYKAFVSKECAFCCIFLKYVGANGKEYDIKLWKTAWDAVKKKIK